MQADAVCTFRQGAERRHDRGVLDLAVAAGLVEFVRAQAGTGGGAVRLNGVSLVQQPFAVELGQQPPHALDVRILVGDIRVLHVHPVAHLAREVVPNACVPHDRLAARGVVVLHADGLPDVLLRDAQFFLDSELDGQSVGVPAGFALDPVALQRLVPAEQVFERAGHDVVDARHAVRRGRSFVEHERPVCGTAFHALAEGLLHVPNFKQLRRHGGKIQCLAFRKSLCHGVLCNVRSKIGPLTRGKV